jgi:acyl carrier protein
MRSAPHERAAAPAPPQPPPPQSPPRADAARLAEEVSGLLVDLVVQHTGYPRELVRFEQELEADLGIDTVKQVELLGAIRQHLDLPADESVTVSDLPTLAQLRDYVVARLTNGTH